MHIGHLFVFFGEILFKSLVHFLIRLFVLLLLNFKNYWCILATRPLSEIRFFKNSLILWVVFYFLDSIILSIEYFNCSEALFTYFVFLLLLAFLVSHLRIHCQIWRFTIMFTFESVIVFFYIWVWFWVNFVYGCKIEIQTSFLCMCKSSFSSTICCRVYFPIEWSWHLVENLLWGIIFALSVLFH